METPAPETPQYSPEDITDLILVTGQSNTLGAGTSYNSAEDSGHPQVFAYTDMGWQVAELFQTWDRNSHPGPGTADAAPENIHNNFALHIGKRIVELDDQRVVGFLLVSEPGEGIQHWTPGNIGMNRVQEKVINAINELPQKSSLDGIVWHQGETDWLLEGTSDIDVSQPAPVNYYPLQLQNLINNLRWESWYNAALPFICGETINATGVNTHLNALNSDADPQTACVEGAGLTSRTIDGSHFDAPALRTIGSRYAEKYYELTNP